MFYIQFHIFFHSLQGYEYSHLKQMTEQRERCKTHRRLRGNVIINITMESKPILQRTELEYLNFEANGKRIMCVSALHMLPGTDDGCPPSAIPQENHL